MTMRWRVFNARGELIAATRYAADAARLAICNGSGAMVRHGNRLMLTVSPDTTLDGALTIGDQLTAAAYGRSA